MSGCLKVQHFNQILTNDKKILIRQFFNDQSLIN